ncbi:hypothetical protein SK128_006113 [Halocaridina rubra]|uniref:Uncharacterized protein n=1 Tax=Halocaridina rubra TaxID=373956 RepID=A0AAN8X1F7_HALRR
MNQLLCFAVFFTSFSEPVSTALSSACNVHNSMEELNDKLKNSATEFATPLQSIISSHIKIFLTNMKIFLLNMTKYVQENTHHFLKAYISYP